VDNPVDLAVLGLVLLDLVVQADSRTHQGQRATTITPLALQSPRAFQRTYKSFVDDGGLMGEFRIFGSDTRTYDIVR
jgi:hypothetical protein